MPQWKDTRRAGVVLLAVVLMGAAPPLPECDEPPMLLGPCPAIRWEGRSPRIELSTVIINHVFVVPMDEGLLAGTDPDFLIYPPDVSPESVHRGEGVVPIHCDDTRPRRPAFRSDPKWVKVVPSFPYYPLLTGRYWDVLCPTDAFTRYRAAAIPPHGVPFLFTGEVDSARRLSPPGLALAVPGALAFDPSLLPVHSSVDGFLEYQKQLQEHQARQACDFIGIHF